MFHLWCAELSGTCNDDHKTEGTRFHLTCLYCRFRRKMAGKYTEPPFYINYTYKNYYHEHTVPYVDLNGYRYRMSNGAKIRHTIYYTLKIDPRSKFTAFRCAAIMVIDKLMRYTRRRARNPEWNFEASSFKPWAEICEFLTNYP